jgi:hypothetical protein
VDEQGWLSSADATAMLTWLYRTRRVGERKARLLVCAAARSAWGELTDERSSRAVEVAERFADGAAAEAERLAAARAAEHATWELGGLGAPGAAHLACLAVDPAVGVDPLAAAERVARDRSSEYADLVREVFGNPFRSLVLDPDVVTATIVSLAQASYEERLLPQGHLDPVRLAVLADALEEAGAGEDLVAHLRAPGPHVRGCFVVDAVLGRQ